MRQNLWTQLAPNRGRRLQLILRHRDDAGEQDQEHQWCPLPDIGNHDRDHRADRVPQPDDVEIEAGNPADDLIDRAVALEKHEEHVTGHGGHDHHRHQQDDVEYAFAMETIDKQNCETEAEKELDRDHDGHDQEGSPDRSPEAAILENLNVIVEPVERFEGINPCGSVERTPPGQAQINQHERGEGDDENQQKLRRNRHPDSEPPAQPLDRERTAATHRRARLCRHFRHCFSAPKVSPRTRCFWMMMPRTTGGIAATRPNAALAPYIGPVIATLSSLM